MSDPNSILVVNGQIWIRSEYRFAEMMQSVPGGKWRREAQAWVWDAKPVTAWRLTDRLPSFFAGRDQLAGLTALHTASLRAQAVKTRTDLPPIPGEVGEPTWQHQRQLFHAVKDLHVHANLLDMGCGKTRVEIEIMRYRKARRVLVIAPVEVLVDNPWYKNCAAYWPDGPPVRAFRKGAIPKRREQIKKAIEGGPVIVLLNYEAVQGTMATWLQKQEWDAVICDESHKIKAPNGKRSKAIAKIPSVMYRAIMTGTLMVKDPLDAWAQYRFLDPLLLGPHFAQFRARYAIMGGYLGKVPVDWQRQDELNERIYSVGHRVTKEVLDLPEEHHITRHVELTSATQRVYRDLLEEMIAILDDGETTVTAPIVLTQRLRLAQVTDGDPEKGDDPAKLDALIEIIDELPTAEPVVVFTRFVATVAKIREAFPDRVSELTGQAKQLDEWKRGDTQIIAVNLQSGGTGIDLTRARYCIYFSRSESLGDFEQSKARVHRPGQTRPVTYIHITARNTIDEDIVQGLIDKKEPIDYVLDQLKTRRSA